MQKPPWNLHSTANFHLLAFHCQSTMQHAHIWPVVCNAMNASSQNLIGLSGEAPWRLGTRVSGPLRGSSHLDSLASISDRFLFSSWVEKPIGKLPLGLFPTELFRFEFQLFWNFRINATNQHFDATRQFFVNPRSVANHSHQKPNAHNTKWKQSLHSLSQSPTVHAKIALFVTVSVEQRPFEIACICFQHFCMENFPKLLFEKMHQMEMNWDSWHLSLTKVTQFVCIWNKAKPTWDNCSMHFSLCPVIPTHLLSKNVSFVVWKLCGQWSHQNH